VLGTGGDGIAGLGGNKGARGRERALTKKYNMTIGSGGNTSERTFSHKMLDRLERVLGERPHGHVDGNPELLAIVWAENSESMGAEGNASVYNKKKKKIF